MQTFSGFWHPSPSKDIKRERFFQKSFLYWICSTSSGKPTPQLILTSATLCFPKAGNSPRTLEKAGTATRAHARAHTHTSTVRKLFFRMFHLLKSHTDSEKIVVIVHLQMKSSRLRVGLACCGGEFCASPTRLPSGGRCLVRRLSRCLWGCFYVRSTFESLDWSRLSSLWWVASSNPLKDWRGKKKGWVRGSTACLPACLVAEIQGFCCLQIRTETLDLPGSPPVGFQTATTPSAFLVLRLSYSDWNYTTDSLGSPACWPPILGLVSLHNHTSHFLIITYMRAHAHACVHTHAV